MSAKSLDDLRARLESDESLQQELRKAAGLGEGEDGFPAAVLMAFAAKHGLEVTLADIEGSDLGLSDEQLDSVTGGALSLTGVSGTTSDDDHKEWINILSFSSTIHRAGS